MPINTVVQVVKKIYFAVRNGIFHRQEDTEKFLARNDTGGYYQDEQNIVICTFDAPTTQKIAEKDYVLDDLTIIQEIEEEERSVKKKKTFKMRQEYEPPSFFMPSWPSRPYSELEDLVDDEDDDIILPRKLRFDLRDLYSLESVVGQYDIIFFQTQGYCEGIDPQHMVVSGTVEFRFNEEGESLNGFITFPESVQGKLCPFWLCDKGKTITFDCDKEGRLHFTNMEELRSDEHWPVESLLGQLKFLSKPLAVRFFHEMLYYISDEKRKSFRNYAESINFETLYEARSLLQEYHHTPLMWLGNHLGFPDNISSLIYLYARFKPPPVFIFEEGDAILAFYEEEDITVDWVYLTVVRPRSRKRKI